MNTPALLVGICLLSSAAIAQTTISFDFTRTSGDRGHYLGQHNPGGFDDNSSDEQWQVQGGTKIQAQREGGYAWVVLNDPQPDTLNGSAPSGQDILLGKAVTLRTRITQLSSGTVGTEGSVGFLFGLNGDGDSTADGFVATVGRLAGGSNDDILRVSTFTDGARDSQLNVVSGFNYLGNTDPHFLELVVTGSGAYELNLFADGDISGSGNDLSRLTSGDFATATPKATLTGTLTGYTTGFVGLYFEDEDVSTGIANLGNLYAYLTLGGTVIKVR